jgi:hypothetical protein
MLKVRSRAAARFKCPRHPRQQYGNPGALPASCDACHAIAAVHRALCALEQAQERAARWSGMPPELHYAKGDKSASQSDRKPDSEVLALALPARTETKR